ncbi:MAG: histidine phosphatase family protein [Gemmatimonadota bacterium]|nr:MAG: histidine phosphatase family protein [Gemmatimonadota bacterium]
MKLDVYVMRHGETEANLRQILMGRGDSPFTAAGRMQPAQVARHLRDRRLACIYSSPMERARRTAALVVESLGEPIPIREEVAIAEVDAGDFTGLSFQEVRRRIPDGVILGEFRYPGGESWAEVQARAVDFVKGLSARHPGAAVLLVTHAGVIAGLVAEYLGEPIEKYVRTRFGHDFLGRLDLEGAAIVGYEKLAGTVDSWI